MLAETAAASILKAALAVIGGTVTSGLGLGVIAAQLISGDPSYIGEAVAGGSFVVAFALVRWSAKLMTSTMTSWKAEADKDRQAATAREELLRKSEADAWGKVADLREQLAQCRDEHATEVRLRLSLEEQGIRDRRRYPPPEGTPI